MQVNKLLTNINLTRTNNTGRIKYIVIHYVGATGGAEANCRYYASTYVGASAHYYVGFNGEVWQSVEDKNTAWHCGAKSYKHPECRNSNSIGIELCVRNKGSKADTSKDWYFEDATVTSAVELTKDLMAKYGVPASRVIRHYDVTGKICPNPYVYNHTKHTWNDFKSQISGGIPATNAPTQAVSTSWQAVGTATCGGSTVNVRSTPNGTKLFTLDKGNRFEVDGQTSGSWTRIKANGQIGWMATQYVNLDQPVVSTPSQPSTPNISGDSYTVKKGDTLNSIAKAMGTSVSDLAKFNGISNPNNINVGQIIKKPVSNVAVTPAPQVDQKKENIKAGQIHSINYCGAEVAIDGEFGNASLKAGIKCIQQAMVMDYGVNIAVDGIWGEKSDAALSNHSVRVGESQEMVRALQINLMLRGYDPQGVDRNFGAGCQAALIQYQKDHGLTPDGIAGRNTFLSFTK